MRAGFFARTGMLFGPLVSSSGYGGREVQPQPVVRPVLRPPAPVERGAPIQWGLGGGGEIPCRKVEWGWASAERIVCDIERWRRARQTADAARNLLEERRRMLDESFRGAADAIFEQAFGTAQDDSTDFGLVLSDEVLLVAARAASRGRLEPAVRSWAVRKLLEGGGPEAVPDQIETLFRAVQSSMYYVPSPVAAQWITAADVTTRFSDERTAGSCVDAAIKLAAALLSVGVHAALVGQSARSDGVFDHVTVAAYDGTGWVRLDASDRAMEVGQSRPTTEEVWIHLPEGEIAHRGAPPDSIRPPTIRASDAFPMVGVGRIGWPADEPLPEAALADLPERRSPWGVLLFAIAAIGLAAIILAAVHESRQRATAAG